MHIYHTRVVVYPSSILEAWGHIYSKS
uniref:Uncharacterized protein n=1 Tax=Arundo donax TaxID=35708 RepID=A0A0A8Y3G3_ARUDO